eukprot:13101322-Ditylum_brightwellii.AAC.1
MEKSCWGLVWWMWNKGKAQLATVAEVDAVIELTNDNSTEMLVLKCIEPTDNIRQLGVKTI